MTGPAEQDPRTASPDRSIWRDLPEDKFRSHLVHLEERTNAVPIRPQTFPIEPRAGLARTTRILSLQDETRLANDLAYVAAVGEGAQSVSAVCIEEYREPPSMVFRFAAIDTISTGSQQALEEIARILSLASKEVESVCDESNQDQLFDIIVRQHYQKLLGRLRSAKWQKPKYLSRTHKKSLWQDFENLLHRVQFTYPKPKNTSRVSLERELKALEHTYQAFEQVPAKSSIEFAQLKELVKSSYHFCTSPTPRDYALKLDSLESSTSQITAAIKSLHQIEKIAAYWRITLSLVRLTKSYPMLFQRIRLAYLTPFKSVETTVAYESWAKALHVHAEIQLVVHYDLGCPSATTKTTETLVSLQCPRVIGTSKYLCYLCYRFLHHHGQFAPRNTHGRLYDQWTVPDVEEYRTEIIERYREVLRSIDQDVTSLADTVERKGIKREPWRIEPMTSRETLLLGPADTAGRNIDMLPS